MTKNINTGKTRKTDKTSIFPEDDVSMDSDSESEEESGGKRDEEKKDGKTNKKSDFPSDATPESSSSQTPDKLPESSGSLGQEGALNLNELEKEHYSDNDKESRNNLSNYTGFEEIKQSENVEVRRRDSGSFVPPDGEEVVGSSEYDNKSESLRIPIRDKDKSDISEIVNGDVLPDDHEEYDYEQARRDSKAIDIENRNLMVMIRYRFR